MTMYQKQYAVNHSGWLSFVLLISMACTESTPSRGGGNGSSIETFDGSTNTSRANRDTGIENTLAIDTGNPVATTPQPRLRGVVQNIDVIGGSFVIAGQTVFIEPNTVFVNASTDPVIGQRLLFADIRNLSLGDRVQIRFTPSLDGTAFIATRISLQRSVIENAVGINAASDTETMDEDEFEIEGTVTEFDPDNLTLVIDDIPVDISQAEDLEELLAMDLVGLIVEAEGEMEDEILVAEEVEIEEDEVDEEEDILSNLL